MAPESLCKPVPRKIGDSKSSFPFPAASTTVIPLAVAARMAEKMSFQYCMATYFPFGPVPWSSIKMTSPARSRREAFMIAPAVFQTPLITADCTIARAR
jgi:hypothetical protein